MPVSVLKLSSKHSTASRQKPEKPEKKSQHPSVQFDKFNHQHSIAELTSVLPDFHNTDSAGNTFHITLQHTLYQQ